MAGQMGVESPALTRALAEHAMVTVTQSADGRLNYEKANEKIMKRVSGDISAWLPSQVWSTETCESGKHLKKDHECTNTECPICLEEFQNNHIITKFDCLHPMHLQCAVVWIRSRIGQGLIATCPLCNLVAVTPVYSRPASLPPATPLCRPGVCQQACNYLVLGIRNCLCRLCPGNAHDAGTTPMR